MARQKKKSSLGRTINGVTFVDSKSYKPHFRAARGTYKPIVLAEGMKKSGSQQRLANLMAKNVFDAVNEFAPNFKDGKFWSRLVSIFRYIVRDETSMSYKLLAGMEIRPDYPMSNQGSFILKKLGDDLVFSFGFRKVADYRLSILRIATDQAMLIPYPVDVVTMDIPENDASGSAHLHFDPLPDDAQILYVVKSERMVDGKVQALMSQKSVTFLKL